MRYRKSPKKITIPKYRKYQNPVFRYISSLFQDAPVVFVFNNTYGLDSNHNEPQLTTFRAFCRCRNTDTVNTVLKRYFVIPPVRYVCGACVILGQVRLVCRLPLMRFFAWDYRLPTVYRIPREKYTLLRYHPSPHLST